MSQNNGPKGRSFVAKPRKRPRKEEIARQIMQNRQRPFINLRLFREQTAVKEDTQEAA